MNKMKYVLKAYARNENVLTYMGLKIEFLGTKT